MHSPQPPRRQPRVKFPSIRIPYQANSHTALQRTTGSPSDKGQPARLPDRPSPKSAPEILVLDKPSSHLDPASRRELVGIPRSLDVKALMVTHDQPYAMELCPRSVILSEGVIAADGPTGGTVADEELKARHRLELPFPFVPSSAA